MTPVGLEPTTVEQAGTLMSSTLGLRWPHDRVEIVERINDFRDLLYNGYPDLKLFDNVFHTIRISSFPVTGNPCNVSSCYQGFVLPEDVLSAEAAWEYGYPLKIRSRWREAHFGIDNERAPRIAITEMAEQTCTERALKTTIGLKVFAESVDDAGKEVFIEAVMAEGTRRTLRFTLQGDAWSVIDSPVRHIVSVSLPSGRRGNLILAQTDGYELSVYARHETVPLYRKFRVASECKSGTLLIQGGKRFLPVAFDHDVVEVGSRTVLKAAGSFLKYRENTTDTAAIKRAEYDRTEMGRNLIGLNARVRGNAQQDPHPFAGRRTGVSTVMPGYEA